MDLHQQLAAALTGRYRVERELGQGGMAVVFLAQDLKHDRRVAVKVLRPELSAVLGGDRFLREIRIAAGLQHPHIVPLYDSGEGNGLLYYVMAFVEGESLRQRLQRETRLPLAVALGIGRDVASALQYSHERGIIHRDIKPENVMLVGDQALVADFGIARAVQAAGADRLTQTGLAIGTPQYMSPEQATGTALDGRCDQYSLACTLYEALSGRPPYTGETALALIAQHSVDPVPSLIATRPEVPRVVDGAVARGMAKDPSLRFATMQQFLEALEGAGPPPARGDRRVLWPRWATAVVAVALAVAVLWGVARGRTLFSASHGISAVAVLPFQDPGASPDSSYLADGVTDGLVTDLAAIGTLKVISRASAATVQQMTRSPAEIAGALGVQAVLQGSVSRSGDSVLVTVRLQRVPEEKQIFARDYRRRLGELPDLQRQITTDVGRALGARLASGERRRLAVRQPVDQRAYEAYLRGRFSLGQGELERAHTLFEEASRLAPDWAPPYVGVANYYVTLPFATDVAPAAVLPQARAALARALELDDGLAEAHAINAYLQAYFDWDWRAAEAEFRRALELQPSYADAYMSYGRFLASRRRLDEAIAEVGRAEELDPLDTSLPPNRALLDYFAGRYDDAERSLRAVLRGDSSNTLALWGLALVEEQQGRMADAIAILERLGGDSPNRRSSLAHAYGVAGQPARARQMLADLQAQSDTSYVSSYFVALVYAGLGERDMALRGLERAYEERSTVLAYLLIDPRLAPLRKEPRFLALASRLTGT